MNVGLKALKVVAVSWITLAVMASGVTGMVLCFGAHGHFSLELAHQGSCRDAADAHGRGLQAVVEMLTAANADCCVPCDDVSLSSDAMSQPMSDTRHSLATSDHLEKVLSAASVEAIIDAEIDLGPPLVPMSAALRTAPALLAQRIIVLRI